MMRFGALVTPRRVAFAMLFFVLAALSIYYMNGSEAAPAKSEAPQAIPVTVQTLTLQKVRLWSEFSGRLHAVDAAEIRPEVSGRITEVRFQDGQDVQKGDILFVIDPRPYEAAVAKAEANLASAKTNAQYTKREMDRASEMVKTQAIAQRVYDERANAHRIATATIKGAEAELKQANLNLEYAHVKAPISGRVSRAEITIGNLVQAGPGAPLLTSIVANDTIYADFEVDEQTYLQSIRAKANVSEEERRIPVQLTVQGDQEHVYHGTIDSFDNRIDVATGTIRARAKFENRDGVLVPGMFVSVSLAGGSAEEALLIPERALGFDQNKKFVYVVGDDNKVAYREVRLGKQIDAQRVVLSGVVAGDRVVVDGVQHVRPDALVAPTEYDPHAVSSAAKVTANN